MIDEIKIMQLAYGTLPVEEREEVQKAIDNDSKLKTLFNDYQKTADVLFKLGNELKSVPIPTYIQNKLNNLNVEKKFINKKSINFNFLNIFKMQYVGVAAAIAVVFGAGFSTSNLMIAKKPDTESKIIALNKEITLDKESDFKFKGKLRNETNLSEKVANLYNFINEDELTIEFNNIHDGLKKGDVFNLKSKDVNNKLIEFKYLEENNRQGINCKTISYNGSIQLSEKDKGTDVKLEFCNVKGRYQLASISLI